jgi:hypothetical protein
MAGEVTTNPATGVQTLTAPLPTGVAAFKAYLTADSGDTTTAEPDANQEETSEVVDDYEASDNIVDESQEQTDDTATDQDEEVQSDGTVTDILQSKVKTHIDGVEHEITVDEAIKGYQRQQDYTRKTQEVARVRTELTGTIENYKQGLQLINEYFTADVKAFESLEWDKIKTTDPAKWASLKIDFQEAQQRASSLQAAFAEASQLQAVQQAEALREQLPVQYNKLVEFFPDYADPVKQKEISSRWSNYGQTQGFTAEELNSIIDHRMLVVLDKAAKYDALKDKTQKVIDKKVTNNPKIIKKEGTTNKIEKVDRDYNTAMETLRTTGSKQAGVEVFKQRLLRGN